MDISRNNYQTTSFVWNGIILTNGQETDTKPRQQDRVSPEVPDALAGHMPTYRHEPGFDVRNSPLANRGIRSFHRYRHDFLCIIVPERFECGCDCLLIKIASETA